MSEHRSLPPEELHRRLAHALDDLPKSSPPIDSLRRRAVKRRRGFVSGLAAGGLAVVAALVVSGVAAAGALDPDHISAPSAHLGVGHGRMQPPDHHPSTAEQRARHLARQRAHQQGIAQCRAMNAARTYLQADRAVVRNGVVQIIGHVGYVHCGGNDDVAYRHHRATTTFILAPGAPVGGVVIGRAKDRPITPQQLPRYLAHTQFGFFRYDGPRDGITRLTELYHP